MRLFFLFLLLSASSHAQVIYKCADKGRITYSESPCADGDYSNNRFAVRDDRLGNVVPEREAGPPRFRSDESRQAISTDAGRAAIVSGPSSTSTLDAKDRCVALDREVADIDAVARQGGSARRQDRLAERKRKARQKQRESNC